MDVLMRAAGLSRRKVLNGLIAGVFLGPLFMACRGATKPLPVAAHVWPGYELLFLAKAEGWLDPAKAVLLETNSATASLEALQRGEALAAALTLDEVLRARAEGLPLRVVLVFNISAGADMVVARPEVGELADLRGRRIGVEDGALGALMLAKVLQRGGLTVDDVTVVSLTVDAQEDAWNAGLLDAAVTYEPVAGRLRAAGGRVLMDSRALPEAIFDVLAVHADALHSHSEAIVHLVEAHLRALAHFRHTPLDAAYVMARRLGGDGPAVLAAFRGLVLPDLSGNRTLLSGAPPRIVEAARDLAPIMAAHGIPVEDVIPDTLVAPNPILRARP